ncbi:hypothetical protein [Frankia sp. Cj3]|uniref:hypothetical protein n=1 Tax=Frankia sp. Cj3 TaxID=2880976 RepID=UPI001EF62430|nr:hypothetical protein [Frankia sp. Cj3]
MANQELSPGAERIFTILAMLLQSALPMAKYIAQHAQPKNRAKFRSMVGQRELNELIEALQLLRR